MAVFLQDDFFGSGSATALNGWAADVGGSWVQSAAFSSSMGYVSAVLNVQATGAGVRSSSTTTPGAIGYNDVAAPSPNYSVTFDVARFLSGGTAGVALRLDPAARNCYFVSCAISSVAIYKSVGGSRVTLATISNGSLVPTDDAYASIEVTIFDSVITVFRDGVLYGAYEDTDAPITDAGHVGVGSRYGIIKNLVASSLEGQIVSADCASSGEANAAFEGAKTVAASLSAAGATPVCYMQSQTYRVGEMRNAGGVATSSMNALPLITSQIYSLSQAPEPEFHSIAFQEAAATFSSSGSTGGGFTGRAIAGAAISAEGVASDVMISRAFEQGEGEFSTGTGGTSIGSFIGHRIVGARMVSAPSYETASFRLLASAFVSSEMSSAGMSVADMSGIVPIRMDAAGTSQASFGPFDVTVPADMAASGSSIGTFRELEFATGRVRALGDVIARFDGITIRGGAMRSLGTSTLSTWFAAVVLTSQMEASGGVSGRMVSLSFSSNIPTPDDRATFLPAEDRTVSLETEDRTVLLEQEDREVSLAAENRIAFV
ncbi:hypothetical protein [Sphingobium sp. MK2]|uniref:hypothetical protein n=1 Tax=Sphingobium sp. MK2 TaxID=3116540 RepID=UPI0032E36118